MCDTYDYEIWLDPVTLIEDWARRLIDKHVGIRVVDGAVYCHPCGSKLYDPERGGMGVQRGGQSIGEAAHSAHLAYLVAHELEERSGWAWWPKAVDTITEEAIDALVAAGHLPQSARPRSPKYGQPGPFDPDQPDLFE